MDMGEPNISPAHFGDESHLTTWIEFSGVTQVSDLRAFPIFGRPSIPGTLLSIERKSSVWAMAT